MNWNQLLLKQDTHRYIYSLESCLKWLWRKIAQLDVRNSRLNLFPSYFLSLQIRYRAFVISDCILKFLTGRVFSISICLIDAAVTSSTCGTQARRVGRSASVRPPGSIPLRPHNTSPHEPLQLAARDHAPIRSLLLLRYITDHITLSGREGTEHWCTCSTLWPNLQISYY